MTALVIIFVLWVLWRIAKALFGPICNFIYYDLLVVPMMKAGMSERAAKATVSIGIIFLIIIFVELY